MVIFKKKRALWTLVALVGMTSASAAWGADKAKVAAAKAEAEATPAKAETAVDAGAAKVQEVKAVETKVETKVEDTSSDPNRGILGPVTIGPTVSLAFPHPANIGVEGRFTDYLGFALDYGFLPQLSVSDASLKISSFDARVRVFPFGGSFFLGCSLGRQSINATKDVTTTVSGQSVTGNFALDISTTYAQPTIGWRWGGRKGIIFGIDFGYQMVLSSSSTPTITSSNAAIETTDEYQSGVKKVTDLGDKVGSTSIPTFTAIHIGYLF
jgi:opacity protein-like surface antigen